MSFISEVKKAVGEIGNIAKKTYGPLSALEVVNNTYANLRYPLDVGDQHLYPHTVEFQCWLPKPLNMGATVEQKTPPNKNGDLRQSGGVKQVQNALNVAGYYVPNTIAVNDNQRLNTRLVDFTRRAELSDLIALYLPQGSWFDRINNDYQTKSITDALGRGAGLTLEVASAISDLFKSDTALIDSVVAPGTELATTLLTKATGGDADTMRDVGLQALGYAINPQFEVIYNATQMREFQFDFTMTPRNATEAQSCLDIINRLKYHASPSYNGGVGRYITPPSYFGIQFKYRGVLNKKLPLISTCVLNTVDVNYSGGLEQWATYRDGMPVQIQMVLNFTELEVMHKALRDIGY